MSKPTIVLVDDHVLLRNGLASLVTTLQYDVIMECSNGKELTEQLNQNNLPDLILMDINMPLMNGYETTLWLKNNYPEVKVVALSMYDDEQSVIRMIKNGARGYILKDTRPQDLHYALDSVLTKGFYYSDMVTGKFIHSMKEDKETSIISKLKSTEIEFLKLAATELTYKEIAQKMHLSPRTIDGYRDQLFEKLGIKSRVGLVIFAIKHGIVKIEDLQTTNLS